MGKINEPSHQLYGAYRLMKEAEKTKVLYKEEQKYTCNKKCKKMVDWTHTLAFS